jgi:cellobiose-specific phosphotransferase system component IIC
MSGLGAIFAVILLLAWITLTYFAFTAREKHPLIRDFIRHPLGENRFVRGTIALLIIPGVGSLFWLLGWIVILLGEILQAIGGFFLLPIKLLAIYLS